LAKIINTRYIGPTFEVALVDSGTTYIPASTVTYTFMADEILVGTAGYARDTFSYAIADIGAYVDDGIGLARKAATFTHDGSSTTFDFSDVVVLRVSTITAEISGTTLTVTSAPSGDLAVGQLISGAGIDPGTGITALNTGSGGTGTYTINNSHTISSQTMYNAEIVAVAKLSSTATLSDGNEAVFYFDLKQFGFYQ
jgi:hypothetical protein